MTPSDCILDAWTSAGVPFVRVRAGQQINGRKSRRTFSDLFLSFPKEIAACPRKRSRADCISASGLAQ